MDVRYPGWFPGYPAVLWELDFPSVLGLQGFCVALKPNKSIEAKLMATY